MTLKELQVGKTATILSVGGNGALRQHFLDMGLIQGTEVTIVKYAPMGDPVEIRIHGYELTIRLEDAGQIEITPAHEPHYKKKEGRQPLGDAQHPGYGEAGIFHEKKTEHPLPENTTLTFALVGNQNCGKTTLFNQLTGSNQHVGNFPGVTVDRKDGVIKEHPNTRITDLPGIYSMSPYSSEEIVTREFLLQDKPKGIINIVDATNIERNMYLTMQLMELEIPMVVALNMMDIVEERGMEIDLHRLPELLGNIPVVPVSARKRTGLDVLLHAVEHHYEEQKTDSVVVYSPEIEEKIEKISQRFQEAYPDSHNVRWHSIKILENDEQMSQDHPIDISDIVDKDYEKQVINEKYNYIEEIIEECMFHKGNRESMTEKADRVLTHPIWGVPVFLGIMAFVFFLTFTVGDAIKGVFEQGLDWAFGAVRTGLDAIGASDWIISLVVDGIMSGVGGILTFLPNIFILFFFCYFRSNGRGGGRRKNMKTAVR